MKRNGSGRPELLVEPASRRQVISDIAFGRTDRELLVVARDTTATSRSDIFSVDLGGRERVLTPLVATRFSETSPAISADGRWLAYLSDETGRPEVYVRPLSSAAGRRRLTSNGGNAPEWLSGSRLVFGDGGRRPIVEIAESAGNIVATSRDSLAWEGSRQSVDGEGGRILVIREPPGWRVVVVKNWVAEARRKLRGK